MKKLRSDITASLPESWVIPARTLGRAVDQLWGWPLSRWRQGSVVMLHVGRCGSTVIGDLLNQHPQIRWDGETVLKHYGANGSRLQTFDTKEFFRRQMLVAGSSFYGCEIKICPEQHLAILHQSLPELIDDLLEIGVDKFILLERKNYLRVLVSQRLGARTKVRHIDSKSRPELTQIVLDLEKISFGVLRQPEPLLTRLEELEEVYAQARTLLRNRSAGQLTYLDLNYEEDILPDPRMAYRKVCGFLKVEAEEVGVRLSRTNPFPIHSMVENYQDLERKLSGTRFEWMLNS